MTLDRQLDALDNLIRAVDELTQLLQERVAQSAKARADIERLDREIDAIVSGAQLEAGGQ